MSIAIGYPSLNIYKSAASQVTDIHRRTSKEEIFSSWIGHALSIGIQGGYSILFNNKKILLDIYKGWKIYRDCLNNTSMLKGNQINTWNGQWLAHLYNIIEYDNDNPLASFNPYQVDGNGIITIQTLTWTKILIAISKKNNFAQLLGYIYIISKSNTTIGFIPFNLSGIRKPIQLYKKLFGDINSRGAEALWGTAYGFTTACTAGAIGIKAMEPKGLKDFIENKKKPKVPKNEEETININVYKIWILAMLNNEELWDKSQDLAELLNAASIDKDKAISTKRKNLVENVLDATNKKQFIAAATEIASFVADCDKFKEIVKEIHGMPTDNVPYFLTLVRFQFKTL